MTRFGRKKPAEAKAGEFWSDESTKNEGDLTLSALDDLIKRRDALPEIQGDNDDTFVIGLRQIAEKLNITGNIIYPGSSTHVGVARVFGKANVVHIEPNEVDCRVMSAAGYKAVPSTIEDYRPHEKADAIVALNSYGSLSSEQLSRILIPNGRIITNNWTKWAYEVNKLPGVTLVGALLPGYSSPEAMYYEDDAIPKDATGLQTKFIKLQPGGGMQDADASDPGAMDLSMPYYPDALFVFAYHPDTSAV